MRKAQFLSLIALMFFAPVSFGSAQVPRQPVTGMDSENQDGKEPKTLSEQIGDLSRQVSELQAKVRDQGLDTAAMKANGDERRSKMSMGAQGGVPKQPMVPVGNNPDAGMMAGMMNMMSSMMGGGGGMPGASPMSPPNSVGAAAILSSLPGFPGASHLYHIGSTNFFLDHPDHITLSLEQQSRLAELRMQSLLRRSEFNRKIQEGEEQLWFLTAADQPNFALVEAKIREIEKLRGDLRLVFIKDVGEAGKLLSDEQRNSLLGQLSSAAQPAPVGTPASPGMGDM